MALCNGLKVSVSGRDDMQALPGSLDPVALACLAVCRLSPRCASGVLDTLVGLVCDFGTVVDRGDELQGGATALLLQLLHVSSPQLSTTVSSSGLLGHASVMVVRTARGPPLSPLPLMAVSLTPTPCPPHI